LWDVLVSLNGEPSFSRRCADKAEAQYVAEALLQDHVRGGWVIADDTSQRSALLASVLPNHAPSLGCCLSAIGEFAVLSGDGPHVVAAVAGPVQFDQLSGDGVFESDTADRDAHRTYLRDVQPETFRGHGRNELKKIHAR